MRITKNTDSIDIEQQCLGLDATRDSFPKDIRNHIHRNRGLHIQIRHNKDAQAFAQAADFANLIAAAPDLYEQLLYVTRVLEAALPDSTETLRGECHAILAKARGES